MANTPQPPSGGCVLKLQFNCGWFNQQNPQPPSGGCVLKQGYHLA